MVPQWTGKLSEVLIRLEQIVGDDVRCTPCIIGWNFASVNAHWLLIQALSTFQWYQDFFSVRQRSISWEHMYNISNSFISPTDSFTSVITTVCDSFGCYPPVFKLVQITVHPTVCYYACSQCEDTETESLVFVSDELKHNFDAFHTFTVKKAVKHQKETRKLNFKHSEQWTDGCAS